MGNCCESFTCNLQKLTPSPTPPLPSSPTPLLPQIIVDKFNKIKANCGSTTNSTFMFTDEALKQTEIVYANRTQMLPLAQCYFTETRVDVQEPKPKDWLRITVQFKPAMRILPGENITFNMAGMTNTNFTGIPYPGNMVKGAGGQNLSDMQIVKDLRDTKCDGGMCWHYFSASWNEGTYIEDKPGFVNSSVTLKVKEGKKLYPGSLYMIDFHRDNRVGTMCSIPQNYDKITIR